MSCHVIDSLTNSARSQSGLALGLPSPLLTLPVLPPAPGVAFGGYESARCCSTPRKMSGAAKSTLLRETQQGSSSGDIEVDIEEIK